MPFRTEVCIEKAQFGQPPFRDLRSVGPHLVDVPTDTQEPIFKEISLGGIQPKRNPAGKGLRFFCEGSEGIDDRASTGGFNDAGVDGKGADIRILWAALTSLLKITTKEW